ncbi:hypothetical protein [Leuconostoc citreum]|uniref:hypothetical protein n=1 Tax=Leuconostoc citreum TaxID=33964 RepID=UPI000BFEF736|nr:hypothetical protein [Leuconostoc citreum]
MQHNNWTHQIDYAGLTQEIIQALRARVSPDIFTNDQALIQYVTSWTDKLSAIDDSTKKDRMMRPNHEYYGIDHFYDSAKNLKMFFDIEKLLSNESTFKELAKLVPRETFYDEANKYFSYNETLPKQKYHHHEILPIIAVEWFSTDGKFTVIDGNNRLNSQDYQALEAIPAYVFFFDDAVKFYKSIFLSDWDAAFYFMHYETFNIVNSDKQTAKKLLENPLYTTFSN